MKNINIKNILLKFNILMTDCSFMFYGCKNIINIDLSSFNTQNVTNMGCMFFDCSNLKEVKLNKNYGSEIQDEIDDEEIKIILI